MEDIYAGGHPLRRQPDPTPLAWYPSFSSPHHTTKLGGSRIPLTYTYGRGIKPNIPLCLKVAIA